jgi:MFS-type transporter involved in bile tolerance (Atg22 family)
MYLLVRDGMGMDPTFSQIFIIIATLSAVTFTYFVGMFADKKGARNTFILVCSLWFTALLIAVLVIFIWAPVVVPDPLFDFSQWTFPFVMVILMGIIAGPSLGGTWVAQRYMIIELAPKEKFGEYFGFSKLSGKVSSSLGPAIWAAIFLIFYASLGFKTYAVAMIAIGILMVAGLIVVLFVRPEKKILQEAAIEPEK